jgi:dihydrofolate synthase/folylpolyglutamate synthase
MPRPTVGVIAIMRDKDYASMLRGLLPLLDTLVCTQASEPRSLTASELTSAAVSVAGDGALGTVHTVADPHAALARARALAGEDGSVLVGGSLYLLEDLRDVLAAAP